MKHLDIDVHKPGDDLELPVANGEAARPSNIPVPTAIPENPIRALSWVYKAEHGFVALLRWITVSLSLALGVLMATQVVLRYGLESPFLGMEELAPMIALWVYFLGMAHATRQRDHITGGIVTLFIKNEKVICAIRIFGTIVCVVAACIFGYYAQKNALFNLGIGRKSPYMGFSKGFWDFSMVVGFALMGFYLILQLISEIRQLTNFFTDSDVKN
ncbi:MAG: TRAP transporter small permease subunit [Desulfobacterales bacterium]|nr:TRAP transporter small permease subunit [Desulfobacterales bacterium]